MAKLMQGVELGSSRWEKLVIKIDKTKESQQLASRLRLEEVLNSLDPGRKRRNALGIYQVTQ